MTKEIGTLAYDWKAKISNTGMLRFCSAKAVQENCTTEKTSAVFENDQPDDRKSAALARETVESKTDSFPRTEELEQGDGRSPSVVGSPKSGLAKIPSSGSAKKRTLTTGSVSPKKRRASAGMKVKNSPSTNQRMISDFFKK